MAIEFWCVLCGQKHAAERAMAGREIACTRCQMMIRVPPLTFPQSAEFFGHADAPASESNAVDHITLDPQHVRPALVAIRCFEISLVLFVCAVVIITVALLYAVDRDGVEGLLDWKWLGSAGVIATYSCLGLVALLLGTLFRGIACYKLRHLDRFLGGESVLTATQCGLFLQALAWGIALGDSFWLLPTPGYWMAFVILFASGFIIEFAVLAVFRRLFLQTGGTRLAGDVRNYAALFTTIACGGFAFLAVIVTVLVAFYSATFRDPLKLCIALAFGSLFILAAVMTLAWAWQSMLITTRRQLALTSPPATPRFKS